MNQKDRKRFPEERTFLYSMVSAFILRGVLTVLFFNYLISLDRGRLGLSMAAEGLSTDDLAGLAEFLALAFWFWGVMEMVVIRNILSRISELPANENLRPVMRDLLFFYLPLGSPGYFAILLLRRVWRIRIVWRRSA